MNDKIASALEQKAWLKGANRLELRESGTLTGAYQSRGRKQEITVEVGRLDIDALYEQKRATSMLVGTAIFGFFSGLLAVSGFLADGPSGARAAILGVSFFIGFFGFICWMEYVRRSYDLVVFHDPFTGKRVIHP